MLVSTCWIACQSPEYSSRGLAVSCPSILGCRHWSLHKEHTGKIVLLVIGGRTATGQEMDISVEGDARRRPPPPAEAGSYRCPGGSFLNNFNQSLHRSFPTVSQGCRFLGKWKPLSIRNGLLHREHLRSVDLLRPSRPSSIRLLLRPCGHGNPSRRAVQSMRYLQYASLDRDELEGKISR